MSQFKDLTRCFLAAGGAPNPDGDGMYFLYTDKTSLISKRWTGSSFVDQERIATSIRPNSSASYVFTPTIRLIVCISDSPTPKLRAIRYDEGEEEWIDDKNFPSHEVHPDSKLATFCSADACVCVFFQNPLGRLVQLVQINNSWTTTSLPADPRAGSPVTTSFLGEKLRIFYISSKDNYIHFLTHEPKNAWNDEIMAKCPLEPKTKRFLATPNQSGAFEALVLTQGNKLLLVKDDNEQTLGEVNDKGEYVPGTDAENVYNFWGGGGWGGWGGNVYNFYGGGWGGGNVYNFY